MNREAERQRLAELLKTLRETPEVACSQFNKGCEGCQFERGELCDIEGREANYLLDNGIVVPPCKVGDRVYWIDDGKIKNEEVFEISIHSDGILVHTGIRFCLEQVFLTREEAEKMLEGEEK